jgi:hypothetical protein
MMKGPARRARSARSRQAQSRTAICITGLTQCSPASRSVLTTGRGGETISARWRCAPGSCRALCLSTPLGPAAAGECRLSGDARATESGAGCRESAWTDSTDFGGGATSGIARIARIDRPQPSQSAVLRRLSRGASQLASKASRVAPIIAQLPFSPSLSGCYGAISASLRRLCAPHCESIGVAGLQQLPTILRADSISSHE